MSHEKIRPNEEEKATEVAGQLVRYFGHDDTIGELRGLIGKNVNNPKIEVKGKLDKQITGEVIISRWGEDKLEQMTVKYDHGDVVEIEAVPTSGIWRFKRDGRKWNGSMDGDSSKTLRQALGLVGELHMSIPDEKHDKKKRQETFGDRMVDNRFRRALVAVPVAAVVLACGGGVPEAPATEIPKTPEEIAVDQLEEVLGVDSNVEGIEISGRWGVGQSGFKNTEFAMPENGSLSEPMQGVLRYLNDNDPNNLGAEQMTIIVPAITKAQFIGEMQQKFPMFGAVAAGTVPETGLVGPAVVLGLAGLYAVARAADIGDGRMQLELNEHSQKRRGKELANYIWVIASAAFMNPNSPFYNETMKRILCGGIGIVEGCSEVVEFLVEVASRSKPGVRMSASVIIGKRIEDGEWTVVTTLYRKGDANKISAEQARRGLTAAYCNDVPPPPLPFVFGSP